MSHLLSTSLNELPYDIREHIYKTIALFADDDERLALMLISKEMHYLVSKVQYRTIFFRLNNVWKYRREFQSAMKTRPAGFFQARVEAFWLVTSLSSCSRLLQDDIQSFQNLRHVAFNFSLSQQTRKSLYSAIRSILSIPLESIWLLGDSLFQLGAALDIESQNTTSNDASNLLPSFHALRTVTHLFTPTWSPLVNTILSHFTSLSHIAFDIISDGKLPTLPFIQWLYCHENLRLTIFLVPPQYQWATDRIFDHFVQDMGAKVVLLDRKRLYMNATLWKHSVTPVDDWRGLWAKGEAIRKKADEPDPEVCHFFRVLSTSFTIDLLSIISRNFRWIGS
ncbi:hypothetical protein DL96DRAFT_1615307 [Flagelloscypha sp. PMI_526]|nr:hypothetical protein DL96DRAFT_1615307 [Flagelloscypha sp. PMI_526]